MNFKVSILLFEVIVLLIEEVERINIDRWDTWVCVEPKCGIDYDIKTKKQIEKEILDIVNSCESNLFENNHTGETKYKYAKAVCECGDNPDSKEHWILGNCEYDFCEE